MAMQELPKGGGEWRKRMAAASRLPVSGKHRYF
jgi:hypothetical protein